MKLQQYRNLTELLCCRPVPFDVPLVHDGILINVAMEQTGKPRDSQLRILALLLTLRRRRRPCYHSLQSKMEKEKRKKIVEMEEIQMIGHTQSCSRTCSSPLRSTSTKWWSTLPQCLVGAWSCKNMIGELEQEGGTRTGGAAKEKRINFASCAAAASEDRHAGTYLDED